MENRCFLIKTASFFLAQNCEGILMEKLKTAKIVFLIFSKMFNVPSGISRLDGEKERVSDSVRLLVNCWTKKANFDE